MLATLMFKIQIFKHLFRFTASHSFCSSRINIPAHLNPQTLNQLLNQRPPVLQLKQVHAQVITQSLSSYSLLIDSLIHCYLVTNGFTLARTLFDQYPNYPPPILLWNLMIRSYSKLPDSLAAINLFRQLNAIEDGPLVVPDKYTFTFLMTSCTHQTSELHGMIVHGIVIKNGHLSNLYVGNSVINLYAVFSRADDACKVFDEMPERDVFSWTSLLRGYAKQGEMIRASEILAIMPVRNKRDVFNYTSMISGFSAHGLGQDALDVFYQMLAENIAPNEVTILGVLKGCSHSGLVEEGSSIFYNMESLWSITPKVEHFGCYVDLLGRAGYLKLALGIAIKMPLDADIVIWRALLSACRIYKDVNLADKITAYVERGYCSQFTGSEVLLSNLYASLSKWGSVGEVRQQMSKRKNERGSGSESKSNPGCSWIEVNGVVHEFRVDDQLHPHIVMVRRKLNKVLEKASLEGEYVVSSTQVGFDLMDEEKEHAVARHSEKLAIAFGLMTTDPGTRIRIVKNLRTCEDCHSALKSISRVFGREIIVRDRSRFHTFKEGKCSCNDYW